MLTAHDDIMAYMWLGSTTTSAFFSVDWDVELHEVRPQKVRYALNIGASVQTQKKGRECHKEDHLVRYTRRSWRRNRCTTPIINIEQARVVMTHEARHYPSVDRSDSASAQSSAPAFWLQIGRSLRRPWISRQKAAVLGQTRLHSCSKSFYSHRYN